MPEPAGLRIRVAATANLVTFRVQRDQVPGAEIVAVVALIGLTGALAEVSEVPPSAGRFIVMVPRHGEGDIAVRTPGVCVGCLKVGPRTARVLVVAKGEHRVRPNRFKHIRSALHAAGVGSVAPSARRASDVTGRANDHRSRIPHGLGADIQRRSTRLVGPTGKGCAGSGERTTYDRHHDNNNKDSPRRPPGLSIWTLG